MTFFMASLGFGAMEVTLALFLKDVYGLNEGNSFLFFAYIGAVLMLTQGFVYRRLAPRLSEVTFIGLGIVFMAIGVTLMGAASYITVSEFHREKLPLIAGSSFGFMASPLGSPVDAVSTILAPRDSNYVPLFVALTAGVVGFAFLTPSAQALVSRRTASERQGEILGVNQSAAALARILGPALAITLYKSTETHVLPYIAGAVLLVLMLPMLPKIKRGG
jgi:carbon starvation protein CstA